MKALLLLLSSATAFGQISSLVSLDTHQGTSSLLTGLVASWRLTEASGANRADSSGNGHTLTNNGTVGQAAAGGGQSGNAAVFNGTVTNYLSTAGAAFTVSPTTGFTFSAWVDISTLTGFPVLITKGGGVRCSGCLEFQVYYDSTAGKFTLNMAQTGTFTGIEVKAALPSPAIASTWYFFSGGYDPGTGNLFLSVNNAADTTASLGAAPLTDGGNALELGSDQHQGLSYTGMMRGCSFWSRVLTSGERTTMYNGGLFFDPVANNTFTLVQHVQSSKAACNPTCTTATLTATTPGNIGFIALIQGNNATAFISSISTGTWIVPTGNTTGCQQGNAAEGAVSCGYILSLPSGATTFTVTPTAGITNQTTVAFWEFSVSPGPGIFDTCKGIRAGTAANTQTGVGLTLAGSSEELIQFAILSTSSVISVGSPYGNLLNAATNQAAASAENTGTGTGPVWTFTSATTATADFGACAIK